jgi:hypothetical protein
MSDLLIAAAIAVGTSVALLSLAYLAALSAHRGQALQDEELARIWTRAPARARPIAAGVVVRAAPQRRPLVPTACAAPGNAVARPPRRRPAHKRATR